MDLHYEENSYHPENNLFPPHNIIDTTGRELYGKVNDIFKISYLMIMCII